ncbi:MAG: stage II sporulation protein R [Oscillospiraceae bacterium]|jgi:stage II sporulation protein R|nr:stage II sporulation protein R [Oscillospiraceae bacterium]
MSRIDLSVLIGVVAALFIGSFTGFGAECEDVRDGVVRLHILANSDTNEDQAVKYAVRDALLSASPALLRGAPSKDAAEEEISARLSDIEDIARATVSGMGYDYPVSARLVNMYFETRRYDTLTVPAGQYDAVRITIGDGAGKNWWCVMFPPMCVPAAAEQETLPIEQQIESLGTQPHYVPKFAVVELIEKVRYKLSGETDHLIAAPEDAASLPDEADPLLHPIAPEAAGPTEN